MSIDQMLTQQPMLNTLQDMKNRPMTLEPPQAYYETGKFAQL